ncbi:hypothetical protein OIE52_18430 [Streptomyces canus]|uniref:hypothetical protein n=1 Tax=Streptomyces canus TaxID=58343 RepID=UPI002E2BE48A|nr:hypothetical protein [Streptomyces canus]
MSRPIECRADGTRPVFSLTASYEVASGRQAHATPVVDAILACREDDRPLRQVAEALVEPTD